MSVFTVTDLSKNYKNKCALDHISFKINQGEIVALIGKNGAGKTTLLNCIAGNITPNTGDVNYKGSNLLCEDSLLNEFGILIQASFFDYLNAFDNLVLLMEASGVRDKVKMKEKVSQTLDLVGLSEKKYAYVKSFSFGMKQRLGLAQALLHEPQFMILDEPFVGLDPLGKEILKEVIIQKARVEKAGVLFSSHDLFDVGEICDRIIMLDEGKKVFDDIFLYAKTYSIKLSQPINNNIKSTLLDLYRERIQCTEDSIKFEETALLNGILAFLVSKNIIIADVQIKENSLYDYFKKEIA